MWPNKSAMLAKNSRKLMTGCRQASVFPNVNKKQPKEVDIPKSWNSVVNDAEKVVGYPTSFLNLRWLLSDEFANIGLYIKKILGTGHPILATARNLLVQNDAPSYGLIVLLVSKANGFNKKFSASEQDFSVGILHKQRVLAEVIEMLRMSHNIHKSLYHVTESTNYKQDMFYGNKIALLCGDYLLSNSFKEISQLRNQEVNELVSMTLRDLVENQFLGLRDQQNNPLPPKRIPNDGYNWTENIEFINSAEVLGNTIPEWRLRSFLNGGSLLSEFCKCALKVANHTQEMQQKGFIFGKHLALTWQAHQELQPFLNKYNKPFSLVSAPMLFHLDYCPDSYKEVENGFENLENVNYEHLFNLIVKGPAIENTIKLKNYHAHEALKYTKSLTESDSQLALEKIIESLCE